MNVEQFDYSVNLLRAILWQYEDAEKLKALIQAKQDWYEKNQTQFWSDWFSNVFNVDTANDFGLAVWGRILDVGLGLNVESTIGLPHFGFGIHHQNFNNGPFARATNGEQALSTDQKRLIIKLRYFQLISRGAVTEINQFMGELFSPYGSVYVRDGLDMTMTYVFKFQPTSQIQTVLNMGLLVQPAAVEVNYVIEP